MFLGRRFFALFSLCSLFALPVPASAQDDTGTESTTPLHPGAKALLFQFGPDLTVGSFDGATISYKSHRSENSAWRYGLTIDANTTQSDNDAYQGFSDTTFIRQTDDFDVSGASFGLSAHYLRYMAPAERVSFYLGGGPEISLLHARQERTSAFAGSGVPTQSGTEVGTRDMWSLGLGGRLGVEWFCASRVSLVGEYMCSASYFQDNMKSTRDVPSAGIHDERTSDAEGFRLASQGARAGVSVYFR